MEPLLLAYCAGVIDSDGTIGIKRQSYAMRVVKDSSQPTYSERVCVKQVEPEAVDLLHSLFGGYRFTAKASVRGGRPLFAWQVTDRKAAACLAELLSYLRIKRAQAENCLALRIVKEESKKARVAFGRGHAGSAVRPAALSAAMERHHARAHELNRVGIR